MSNFFEQIPGPLQNHLKGLVKSIKVEEGEEPLEKLAQAWLEKKIVFEEKIKEMNMEEVEKLEAENPQGALVLTYSGSLVNIGPIFDGTRTVKYSSIGIRINTPESAESDKSKLNSDISLNNIISFSGGPVKSTSQVYKIAVCKDKELSAEEELQTIFDTGTLIEEEFIEVNKTLMNPSE